MYGRSSVPTVSHDTSSWEWGSPIPGGLKTARVALTRDPMSGGVAPSTIGVPQEERPAHTQILRGHVARWVNLKQQGLSEGSGRFSDSCPNTSNVLFLHFPSDNLGCIDANATM